MPSNDHKQYRMMHNVATGEVEYIEVTDEWLLANKPDYLRLLLDKEIIEAGGSDVAMLTIQLVNPLGKNKRNRFEATIVIDDVALEITGNGNGKATIPVVSVEPGIFEITARDMPSDTLELEVV